MKKLLIGTALLFAALPFTFDGFRPRSQRPKPCIAKGW